MDNYAEATCVLKMNIHCQACKMRIVEVLGSICGEYNVEINAEEGLVRVFALVDPNLLIRALARTGYHAELKWAKIQHPRVNRNYCDYNNSNGYDPYNYHGYNLPHGHGRPMPGHYPRPPIHPYYQGSDSFQPDPFHSARWPSDVCRRPRPFAELPFL